MLVPSPSYMVFAVIGTPSCVSASSSTAAARMTGLKVDAGW
ncbi:hypothetical protein [Streptomyces sp. CL12-4]